MKKFILLLLLAAPALAQNVRYDAPFPTISPTAPPFLIANVPPNSPTLAVCHSPANQVPCTNYATTYTSLGVACSNGAQDTPQPMPSACQSTGDAYGNIGFWAPAGTYDYTVCIGTACYGPYTVTLGGSGGSSITLKTNNVNNGSQSTLNLSQGSNITLTDNGTGTVTIAGSGGGTPGGSNTQVQFNNSGAFGGASVTNTYPNAVTFNNSTAALGVSNLNGRRYVTADYNWSRSPAGTVSVGANTVTLSPCPAGIMTTYGFTSTPWTQVYISTTGTPEAVLVTATTCTQQGGSNGTITFTAANSHSAGFTVGSASVGWQEATNASMQTVADSTIQQKGAVIGVPGEVNWKARVTVMSSRVALDFSGVTVNCQMSDTCLYIGDSGGSSRVYDVNVFNFYPRPGVVTGNFAAIETNAQNTHLTSVGPQRNSVICATCTFGSFITVDDDQAFVLDDLDTNPQGGWSHCGTDFCSVAVKTGTGAGVGRILNSNLTLNCAANGVDWKQGNTLEIANTVIQGYGQFGVRAHGSFSNISSVKLDNVYFEVGNCQNLNPLGIGITGLATDGYATIDASTGPYGALQRFANTGGTQYNYYIVVHTTGGAPGTAVSAPFLAGMASTNGVGTITVKWLQIGQTGTITYDVIRTSGSANNPAPYTANCTGGSPTACGSVATGLTVGGSCAAVGSTNICSFDDNAALNTTAYTVTTSGTYWPNLWNSSDSGTWPGAIVYAKYGADTVGITPPTGGVYMDRFGDNISNSQVNPVSQILSAYGPEIPEFFATECSLPAGGFSVVCLHNDNITFNGATLIRTAPYNSFDPNSLKGRFIFTPMRNQIGNHHLITLVDSAPAKTLATNGFRPTWDANDSYIALDSPSGALNTAQVAFGAPVALSNYIGSNPDNSNFLERLTSSAKTFKVPVTINSGSTAGFLGVTQGTAASTVANTVGITAPAAVTAYNITLPGAGGNGTITGNTSGAVFTGSFSGDSAHSKHLTAQVASLGATTVCDSVAGACNVAGLYKVSGYIVSTVSCGTPGPAAIAPLLTWTDAASAKSAVAIPLTTDASATATAASIALGTVGTHWGYFTANVWSTGAAPIQISATYTACSVGTGTYELDATVTQLQ